MAYTKREKDGARRFPKIQYFKNCLVFRGKLLILSSRIRQKTSGSPNPMNARQPQTSFRAARSFARGVALWLAFLLATHAFWCGLAGSLCESDSAPSALISQIAQPSAHVGVPVASHTHLSEDICAGVDESQTRAVATISALPAPVLVWIALVFLAVALTLLALTQRAAVFGRDGPVSVPPLHSRLVRASLPHRAPPVFLI